MSAVDDYLKAINDQKVREYLTALHNQNTATPTPAVTPPTYRDAPDSSGTATVVGNDGTSRTEPGYQEGTPPDKPGIWESYQGADGKTYYRQLDGPGGELDPNKPGTKKTGTSDDGTDAGATAYITNLLKKYGLDSLAGWAMDQLKSGATADEIIQSLRDQPAYKQRFAGMDLRAKNGLGALSEDEYIAYENTAKDYMQRAGITGYTTPESLAPLIGNFANVGQVADRIQQGYQQVSQAPPEVRQEMQKWFGVSGDSALATFFLDPDKALPELTKAAQEAVIGGYGLRSGLNISQGSAGGLADMGLSNQQIQNGMQQAGQLGGLQSQTVDEAAAKAAGLSADTLAEGVLGAGQAQMQDIKNRLGTRKAQFDTRGTAGASQKGAYGLEVAQ